MSFLDEPSLLVALLGVFIGVALLSFAADEFVEGAAGLAFKAQVSPILVGAVIVGFGTSAPELLVSAIAAGQGDVDLGIGNIVGSNMANMSLVLGTAAMLVPLAVPPSLLRREAPLSLAAVLLFAGFTVGDLQRREGVILLLLLVIFIGIIAVGGRNAPSIEARSGTLTGFWLRTGLGLLGTVGGAWLLVWGATAIADEFGLTGGFIGFTLVALGTSLPELVTSVAAARKRETELILGNLLGSNVFNSLAVGGVVAILGGGTMQDTGLRTYGIGVMAFVAVAAVLAMFTRKRMTRIEAGFLLIMWVVAAVLLARTSTEGAVAVIG